MQHWGLWCTALAVSVGLGSGLNAAAATKPVQAKAAQAAAQAAQAAPVSFAAHLAPSVAARQVAAQVLATGDHGQRPFAIVDKRAALLTLFSANGQVLGSSSVLLGSVVGDESVPGVGDRTQSGQLQPGDATTPAGRFQSTPGLNHTGEAVVWVDPDTAFAIHRLRPGAAQAERARRLAEYDPGRKRVSAGCVVVPVAFYESVVHPVLGRQPGVVYVLPEQGDWTGLLVGGGRRSL